MEIKHTIRIEMLDESVLVYRVSEQSKNELYQWMDYRTDQFHDADDMFLRFHAWPDRYVFVRIADIGRLIFCWDHPLHEIQAENYIDNFQLLPQPDGTVRLYDNNDALHDNLADAIIKLRGKQAPFVFPTLEEGVDTALMLDENSFRSRFVQCGYLTLRDEDGEDNFIPVQNISVIEAHRGFVIPDDMWNEMNAEQRDGL
jgi:hypothetical protein